MNAYDGELLAELAFGATLIEWRGPPPYVFVAVPDDMVGEVAWASRRASYGWGCVPASGSANGAAFTTALFPRNGGYLVPIKVAVRRETGLVLGDVADVTLTIRAPG